MKMLTLVFALSLIGCGTEESRVKEEPKNALCKTLKDGSVERHEISLEETGLRSVMATMGFVPCY